MTRGFTLIELLVAIGIFGILMVAGTDLLVKIIQNGNRAAMENEVRQNASLIMQDITAEVRSAATVTVLANNDLVVGSKIYHVDLATGVLTKNGTVLTSGRVAALSCTDCNNTTCIHGLSGTAVHLFGTSRVVEIALAVQQNVSATRADFCAKVVLKNTVTLRQF